MQDRLNLPPLEDIKKILRLEGEKLPSFPQAAAKLLEASKDEKSTLADLAQIVETDPGISVRVLEIVNSAMYGLKRKITVLSEAVVFLGVNEIKKLALGMTVFEKLFKSGHAEKFDRLLFWRHCISVAVLSMEIAKETQYPDPEEAYIAGLLHDIGKVILDAQGRLNYGDFIDELENSTDLVIEKERDCLGLGHDDVGAFFCSLWKLPEKLTLAVKYHHQPFGHAGLIKEEKLLVSIISVADFLCWSQGVGSFDIIRPPILTPEVEKTIDLSKINLIGCIQKMNSEVDNISKFYHFVFPSASRLKENLLRANLKLSKVNTRYYYQSGPLVQLSKEPGFATSHMTSKMKIELGKPLSKAKSIKEVLDIVMYQVGLIFEPLHWSILLKDPKTEDMVFSVVVGTGKDKLQGVRMPKGEGIAGFIMEKGQSLIVEDVEKDPRFSDRVDKYTGFKTRSIIGTPLKTEDKIFGVIELINKISEDIFTQNDLLILSSIAEYAAIAIERAYYNQALTALATKDALTGLKNRWSFERAVSSKDDVMKRYGTIFSMLIAVVNGLREEKDADAVNDDILKKTAEILNATKRRLDDIFRYGEDTFILLLPLTYADDADTAKYRILKAFSSTFPPTVQSQTRLQIQAYTVSAEDSVHLKNLVKGVLPKSRLLLNEGKVKDIEENLQTLIENENKKTEPDVDKGSTFGKAVSLSGEFILIKTREQGYLKVERLSMQSVGIRVSKPGHIEINDFLDIKFILDDLKKSAIERRILVREIKANYILADFYNPPPYSKDLGFYLMS
ncbi:MAG: diguanylate cyclase [Desulfobacterales bacterium RIFOXYA12_FULL_46_15]|nr:MAG: diguanylate cyclase [Desulfobacterales bacterium RIFOXYA12_FULL_46_15]